MKSKCAFMERETGRYRWYLYRAVAGTDAAGAVTRWYGTGTDIDDQKKNLEELRISMEEQQRSLKEHQISEERFRNLVMALPAAVYTTDETGLITLFNEHAVELWGRRPEVGKEHWCGSWKLLRPDGSPLPLDQCPMAVAHARRPQRPRRGSHHRAPRRFQGLRPASIPNPSAASTEKSSARSTW